jgi:hypothetical protein
LGPFFGPNPCTWLPCLPVPGRKERKKEKAKKEREDVCGVQIKRSKRNGGWTHKTRGPTLLVHHHNNNNNNNSTAIYIYIYAQPFIKSIYI